MHRKKLTVEIYVRPAQLLEPIDAKIKTLKQLASTDHIDDLSLHAWPETITLSEETPYSDAVDAFERMEAWADEHDISIRPPFTVRTTTSTITGETRTKLRTPLMCLTVYVGEQLANVFPHSRGDNQYTVTDAIAGLRTNELDLFMFDPDPFVPAPDRCPECENWLMNVQGIGVCQDCDRIEIGTASSHKQSRHPRFITQI